ncbi:metal ABC transporter ATP-binding protein [Agromyces atrinae]|uniref:zinc ABC transporter ATP-binding protein AztA n=1 Tax=Agromyces atrinae TaxID=592376 RepID=UPI001F594829|nr:zinc ABC transporter ATP-binding protein AztA [Agromyces atrinae]MCI2956425.1 metal ABC transporter ATP-binding protein [Agromyces atrinae]
MIMVLSASVRGAVVSYGRVRALDGVDLDVTPGTHTAILGPNGSGKSTLLSVIAGVERPSAGHVELAAPGVAFVVQRSEASDRLPVTVRDTVAMGRWAERGLWRRMTRADHTLIDACIDRLGLTELADRRLGELSGGQRQRALVAQGLAQRAPLLLLDEPATGLDSEAQQIIDDVIADEVSRGTTVVTATHHLESARRADRCVLMARGRIAFEGSPAEALDEARLSEAFLPAH